MAEWSVAWAHETPPSLAAAVHRVEAIRPGEYARTRNHVQGAVTGLSPYVTHGLITLRDVLQRVNHKASLAVGHKLVYEFGWREYFRHVWACEADGIFSSFHEGPRPEPDYARELPADIREARTGVPAVDQAVRTLYASGTLHNHARMWLASYVVHLRHVHWRAGADWMVAHLLDGDLASNHLSWQWVAGTGSHKPYLFNAENVARYAPASWHSPGSVIDQSYAALDAIARGSSTPRMRADAMVVQSCFEEGFALEPILQAQPPVDLGLAKPASLEPEHFAGREVWLVHPWSLRVPPASLGPDAVVLGIYLQEYHAAWPWPEARWRWVDAAMAAVTTQRCFVTADVLTNSLARAACVRMVSDPHIDRWLEAFVQLDPPPRLFPVVNRRCTSFSQWWTRATRGLERAEELL